MCISAAATANNNNNGRARNLRREFVVVVGVGRSAKRTGNERLFAHLRNERDSGCQVDIGYCDVGGVDRFAVEDGSMRQCPPAKLDAVAEAQRGHHVRNMRRHSADLNVKAVSDLLVRQA